MIDDHKLVSDWTRKHQNHLFLLVAFAIPVAIRAIPEILMGPYIIGFDTMAIYVPNIMLWLHNGVNIGNFFAIGPLFYSIIIPIVAAGGSPVWILKIISPIILGFLGVSMYFYAERGLGWSSPKSSFVAILGTVYFVALRTSWDLLREELSLIFFFVVLMLMIKEKENSLKHYVLLSFAMLAVVLADPIGAVIMFGMIMFTIIPKLLRRKYFQAANLIVVSLPATLYFVTVYLSGLTGTSVYSLLGANGVSSLVSWNGFTSYPAMLTSETLFFLYCYLPLLPLAVVSLRRFENFQLRSWLLISLILLLLPSIVSPYRWLLILMYPLAFYVTESVSRIKTIKWKRFRLTLYQIAVSYLIISTAILSFGFIFMSPEHPFVYFDTQQLNRFASEIPSSMQQNTISIVDCQSTVNALQWFKNNENCSALLLTHSVFYCWALLALNQDQIINYHFGDPGAAATVAVQDGHTDVFLIWWVKGHGWYGLSTLPPSFEEIYHSGKIAIYSYNETASPSK